MVWHQDIGNQNKISSILIISEIIDDYSVNILVEDLQKSHDCCGYKIYPGNIFKIISIAASHGSNGGPSGKCS